MNRYIKFLWDWKTVTIPLFLFCGILLDYAHVEFLFEKNQYNGVSYSVEINFSRIWHLITENINNLIKGILKWNT